MTPSIFQLEWERERDLMNWATFNYVWVYICICDTRHSSVTVHWERFQESRKFWTECGVTVVFIDTRLNALLCEWYGLEHVDSLCPDLAFSSAAVVPNPFPWSETYLFTVHTCVFSLLSLCTRGNAEDVYTYGVATSGRPVLGMCPGAYFSTCNSYLVIKHRWHGQFLSKAGGLR